MTAKEMLGKVDHTQLKAFATWEDIQKLCDEAIQYHTASVCVPPCYIKRIHDTYGDKINICTVVGFPLGYSVTEAKVAEVRKALEDGCNEIDMVVNISDVKNGLLDKVEEEIRTLKKECGHHILKVIIETCYLTEEEKIAMCKAVTNAGADFIKTSTGFGTGATPNAMANMQAVCDQYVPSIKAYLLIPLVGSLFADFLNSLVITFFINLL